MMLPTSDGSMAAAAVAAAGASDNAALISIPLARFAKLCILGETDESFTTQLCLDRFAVCGWRYD
jgi:hypothetical protein